MFVRDQHLDELLVLSSQCHDAEHGHDRAGGREYRRFKAERWELGARWAEQESERGHSVYYKTCLFQPNSIRLVKENAQPKAYWVWADLDKMEPGRLPVPPTVLVESSPGRYQCLYRLREARDILEVEGYAHALSRYGDYSGWDIGQELRVPGTRNYKYKEAPEVKVVSFTGEMYEIERLGLQREDTGTVSVDYEGMPALGKAETTEGKIPQYAQQEAQVLGKEKRSGALWKVINQMREDGYTKEQTFTTLWWAPINKYRLDGRDPANLWRDVDKAYKAVQTGEVVIKSAVAMPKAPVLEERIRWPLLAEMAIETYKGATLFTDETIALMFLSAYSAVYPSVKVEGTNLGLWTMLLGGQASGKSTLIQGLGKMIGAISPGIGLVTSGSPEGIMEKASQGPTLLAFEEYSEQLKQMSKRDGYAVTNKELYQRMFDGAPLGHATRKNAIQAGETFVVMMAGTNADTWRKYGDPEDLSNGYLSRFVVIAADLLERSVNRGNLHEAEEELRRAALDRHLMAMGLRVMHLSNMVPQRSVDGGYVIGPAYRGHKVSDGDLILLEYQRELEKWWDLRHDLDEASLADVTSIPPGRTLTKARKIAALLELAEESPQLAGPNGFVRTSNVRAAVALSALSARWAQRAINWLQNSEEKQYVDKIMQQLNKMETGEWARPWDIAVNIRGINATRVRQLLQTLADSNMVEKRLQARQNGQQSELWRAVKS